MESESDVESERDVESESDMEEGAVALVASEKQVASYRQK